MKTDAKWEMRRRRAHEIVDVGAEQDKLSRAYGILITGILILNLLVSTLYTFDLFEEKYGWQLKLVEGFTVVCFFGDYLLRVWSAKYLYPDLSGKRAALKYMLSFMGIVDVLSFLPYFLPIFFPTGVVAFRLVRVVRIFRLFRINAYYDSLNVITEVLSGKKQQLLSSVFIILVLMLASSLCMYSLENEAQPEVFTNAFSGIWWAASTLLTVGYGDIYPVTPMGRTFGIFITFLGVGMVAIPTGIISAGFVDQYSRIKRMSEYGQEEDIHFIRIDLVEKDRWVGKSIAELGLPRRVIVAVIQRGEETLVPRGNFVLQAGDQMVIGAESFKDSRGHVKLKEIVVLREHPWNGQRIRELDISRHSIIVLVKRRKKVMIPHGDLVLREGDVVILYTQTYMKEGKDIEI